MIHNRALAASGAFRPSLRDHVTDGVEGYSFLPLLAAAAPLVAGLFGKKKKKKPKAPKPAPVAKLAPAPVRRLPAPAKAGGVPGYVWGIGGVVVVGLFAMVAMSGRRR